MKEASVGSGFRPSAAAWFVLALIISFANAALRAKQLGVPTAGSDHVVEAIAYGLSSFLFGLACLFWKKYRSMTWYFIFSAAVGATVLVSALSRA